MTLMQRIRRAGQDVSPGWDERDVDRVWHGLKRKQRRRAIAAGAGGAALAAAGVAVWALLVVSGRDAVVGRTSRPAAPLHQAHQMRFADGSLAVPWGTHETSLTVVEDTPQRVVVALAKGGARFEVTPRPERVFAVRAGDVTVSVLGTAFSVERIADRVGVAVTRGAVHVDWGVGARRLAAGEDGWFPPLQVSPSTDEGHAQNTAKEARPVGPRKRIARSVSTPPPASKTDESGAPAVASAADQRERTATVPPAVAPAADQHERTATVSREADSATLMADADRARLAGRFEEGAALLQRLVREHPGDSRAPLAAFSLGRLLFGELGRPAEAARAFARARALAPDGPLAQEALAREAEAWTRAGDPERAKACEAEYRMLTRKQSGPPP